jgi:hypothetical protein
MVEVSAGAEPTAGSLDPHVPNADPQHESSHPGSVTAIFRFSAPGVSLPGRIRSGYSRLS